MIRNELIEKLSDIWIETHTDSQFEKLADFILANWKEFIPEGYGWSKLSEDSNETKQDILIIEGK